MKSKRMFHNKRVFLAAMLIMTLVLTSVIGAFAANIEIGVTKITTKQQLSAIREELGGSFSLENDLVFTEEDFQPGGAFYNNGKLWEPIGKDGLNAFIGEFDGKGHTISGLQVNASGDEVNAGLFGTSRRTIKNLNMENCTIKGEATDKLRIGAVVGYVLRGDVSNCSVSDTNKIIGSLVSGNAFVGGVIGNVNDASVTNCVNAAQISIEKTNGYFYIGGIAARCRNTQLVECINTADITVSGNDSFAVGGISGYVEEGGLYTKNYNTGNLSVSSLVKAHVGGLVGYSYGSANNNTVAITESYNLGNVSGYASSNGVFLGGLAGYTYTGTSVSDCFNTGNVSTIDDLVTKQIYMGGAFGNSKDTAVNAVYSTGTVNANNSIGTLKKAVSSVSGYFNGGTLNNVRYVEQGLDCANLAGTATSFNCVSLTPAQMTDKANFTGFDFDKVWELRSGATYQYPTLRALPMERGYTVSGVVAAAIDLTGGYVFKPGFTAALMQNGTVVATVDADPATGVYTFGGVLPGVYQLVLDGPTAISVKIDVTVKDSGVAVEQKNLVSCDLNHDGFINYSDYMTFLSTMGTAKDDPAYLLGADVNNDGFINYSDYMAFMIFMGR